MADSDPNWLFFPDTSTTNQDTNVQEEPTTTDNQSNQPDSNPLGSKWEENTTKIDNNYYAAGIHAMVDPDEDSITLDDLSKIKQYYKILSKTPRRSRLGQRYDAYRDTWVWINEVRNSEITRQMVEQSGIMTTLKRLLEDHNADWRRTRGITHMLEEELMILYKKFGRRDYSFDPNRGFDTSEVFNDKSGVNKISYTLNKNWELYKSAKQFGNNGLVNGQLWFSRLQLLRDGAHGSRIGGISGTVNEGAYSILMALHEGNEYQDRIIGDGYEIEYQGTTRTTEDATNSPTNMTKALQKSEELLNDVRVIRKITMKNPVFVEEKDRYITAYRYDGLYRVVQQIDTAGGKEVPTFKMRRVDGQAPIRQPIKEHP